MSAEERLFALEQLVAAMQGEVITALTAAAQAEQRATDAETRVLGVRCEGVVDTRLLRKPKSFDWSTDSWRQFKFTFLGYAGALDSRLKQAMIESEVLQEAAITNSALPARDQRVSTQLHYMLVLLRTCNGMWDGRREAHTRGTAQVLRGRYAETSGVCRPSCQGWKRHLARGSWGLH